MRALAAALFVGACVSNTPPPAPRTLPPGFPTAMPVMCSAFFTTEAEAIRKRHPADGLHSLPDTSALTTAAALFYHIAESVYGRGPELTSLHARFLTDLREDIETANFDVNGERAKMFRECKAFGLTQPETKIAFSD